MNKQLKIILYCIFIGVCLLTMANILTMSEKAIVKKEVEAKLLFVIDKPDDKEIIAICQDSNNERYSFYISGHDRYAILYFLYLNEKYSFQYLEKEGKKVITTHPKKVELLKV